MASTTVRSLGVALESGVGSVASGAIFPDASGLSYVYPDVQRGTLSTSGELPSVAQESARSGPYAHPAEPAVVYVGGNRQRLRSGTASFVLPVRTLGAGITFANYIATGLGRLLASGFGVAVPSADTETIAGGSNETGWTAADAANLVTGELLKLESNSQGLPDFSAIVNRDEGDESVTVSPAFGAVISSLNDTMRRMNTYYGVLGTGALGSTVALQINGDGWRSYMVGARWQSLRLFLDQRQLYVEVTMQGMVYDDHGNAAVIDPTETEGAIAHLKAARSCITANAVPLDAVGAGLGSTKLNIETLEVTITNTLSMVGSSDNALAYSDLEVTNQEVAGTVQLSNPVSAYDDLMLNREHRSLMFGFGPGGAGQGACIYLPAAIFTADSSLRGVDGERVTQTLAFTQGRSRNDNASTGPANSHFRFGLGL